MKIFINRKSSWRNASRSTVRPETWETMSPWNVKRWRSTSTQTCTSPSVTWNIWPRSTWRNTVFVIGSVWCRTTRTFTNCATSESAPTMMTKKTTSKKFPKSSRCIVKFHLEILWIKRFFLYTTAEFDFSFCFLLLWEFFFAFQHMNEVFPESFQFILVTCGGIFAARVNFLKANLNFI